MSPGVWLGITALGAVGALARHLGSTAIRARVRTPLPVGTMAVNLAGAFALGVVAGTGVDGSAYVLVAGGLLGTFTTFSSWMLEVVELGEERARKLALAALLVPLAGGLAATAAGWALGQAL